jgi:hypothetical protein
MLLPRRTPLNRDDSYHRLIASSPSESEHPLSRETGDTWWRHEIFFREYILRNIRRERGSGT